MIRFFAPLVVLLLALPMHASAQVQVFDELSGAYSGAQSQGVDVPNQPEVIVGRILKTIFSLLGVVFLLLVIYAGFLWMTAQGNADQVSRAKSMIAGAIIGLLLMFAAYMITELVIVQLTDVTLSSGTGG